MRKRLLALLLFLLLLTQTVHADVISLSPRGLRNRLAKESSVLLDEENREYIALTDLTGWQHPHTPLRVIAHEKGSLLYILCLYTDEYGRVWAYHHRYDGPGCNCWVPFDGLTPASADPLPAAPGTLPVPWLSSRAMLLLAAGMIVLSCLLTLAILRKIKRNAPAP